MPLVYIGLGAIRIRKWLSKNKGSLRSVLVPRLYGQPF